MLAIVSEIISIISHAKASVSIVIWYQKKKESCHRTLHHAALKSYSLSNQIDAGLYKGAFLNPFKCITFWPPLDSLARSYRITSYTHSLPTLCTHLSIATVSVYEVLCSYL